MTNTVTNILSHDEELALRKPIEDYVGKIQAEIDELREEGTNKVLEYSEEIEVLKRDKIYTKSEKDILLVVVAKRQVVTLKKIIKSIDPYAFIIVSDVHETLGEGFSNINV